LSSGGHCVLLDTQCYGFSEPRAPSCGVGNLATPPPSANCTTRWANNPSSEKTLLRNNQNKKLRKDADIQNLKIGTWNVRSLYRTGTLTAVVSELDRYELAILAIQENRWSGSGNHKTEKATLFYSGGSGHERGVGFVATKWFNIVLINCYAPTEDKNEETKNDFFKQLEALYDTIPQNMVKIVLEDFNAKIEKEIDYKPTIGQQSLHNDSNDNGVRVISFETSKGMTISSTFFPHKQIHKQTWMSLGRTTKNQIDHVMIDSRRKHCITDVKSCRGVCGISDHFLVRIQVYLRLSVKWREKKRVTQKFNEKLEKTIKQAAKNVLGFEDRRKPKKWFNDRSRRALEERDTTRMALIKNPNESNRRALAIKQRETKKIIRNEKIQWEKSYINDIEKNFKSNIKVSYNKTNNIKSGYKLRTTILKEPNGTLITDKTDIAEKFREMFETILLKTRQTEPEDYYMTTVEQTIHEPTTEEIKMAINILKNGKAPGEDGITTELLRKSGKAVMEKLEQIITKAWREEKIPEAWNLLESYALSTKKAYDSVKRESLWKAMEKLGVPAKITKMIRAYVQNSKCMVKFNGQPSKAFMINTGLKQGDALSPMLFNIALEKVVRNALNTGIEVKLQESKTIKLIAYANDIVLLSESKSDLQSIAKSLMDESKLMGLTINEEKT
ncbi:craniofacial development protein 2-like, partial [Aphis craccivora]